MSWLGASTGLSDLADVAGRQKLIVLGVQQVQELCRLGTVLHTYSLLVNLIEILDYVRDKGKTT